MLRDVVEEDLEAFFEHQRDPLATQMASFPSRDRDAFLLRWWSTLGDDAIRKKTIAEGDDVCGYVASWSQGEHRLVAYWLGRAFWGRGLATTSLSEFVARHDKTRPLHAFVAVSNAPSRRVLEKCGFVRASQPTKGKDGVEEILMALR
jgi:RimJ/RimL family protein N-acetyltransferase